MTIETTVVLGLGGIGEAHSADGHTPAPGTMFALFADAVQAIYANNKVACPFRFEELPWHNSFGPIGGNIAAQDFYNNRKTAMTDLHGRIEAYLGDGIPVIPWGYSGGALVVSDTVNNYYSGEGPVMLAGRGLRGIFTQANPRRHIGDSWPAWYGVVGQHSEFNVPLVDIANPADVICCCPGTSPIRDLYALLDRFSFADPLAWGLSVFDYVTIGLLEGSAHTVNASPLDWWFAVAYMRGYLFDGQHTTWYAERIGTAASNFIAEFDSAVSVGMTRDFCAPEPQNRHLGQHL